MLSPLVHACLRMPKTYAGWKITIPVKIRMVYKEIPKQVQNTLGSANRLGNSVESFHMGIYSISLECQKGTKKFGHTLVRTY